MSEVLDLNARLALPVTTSSREFTSTVTRHQLATSFRPIDEVLRIAFSNGGFAAGGFVGKLLADDLGGWYVYNYLRIGHAYDHSHPYIRRGDIDLFFHDADCRRSFIVDLTRQMQVPVEALPSGNGDQFIIDGSIKVQVLSTVYGTPDEVIRSFDIRNSMVALTHPATVVVASCYDELRKADIIHVDDWQSPFTVWRVSKYIDFHEYRHLSFSTARDLASRSLDLIKQLKEEPTLHVGYEKRVVSRLKRLMPLVDDESLLLIGSIFPDQNYSVWNKLLERRAVTR